MKLFSYTYNSDLVAIGVETDKGSLNLSNALEIYQKAQGSKNPIQIPFLQMLVEMGYCSEEVIKAVLDEPWVTSKKRDLEVPEDAVISPPISRPSKIICMGRNYTAHAKELNHSIPKEPLFFAKAPSAIIGHKQDIIIPSWLNTRVDHEAELGVVIGKQAKNVTEDSAINYVAGFTIINDITAREMQKKDIKNGNPWFPSKSIDTFLPMGPFIVPADIIKNPDNLEIELKVNNKTRQKANTKDMIFNISQIISYITKFMTLEPGDIIATGTPEGVSPVKHGDAIDISISGLGTLTNKVIQQ